jgi:hydroxymethylglutaryl-CoA lyase
MGIEFTDVTLRDGLQMERVLTVEQKFALLQALVPCGYDRIELTSFVHPTKMPQFADSEALCEKVYGSGSAFPPLMAFVPNERGVQRLMKHPIPWAACFVSTSEQFNARNVNSTIDESLTQVRAVVAAVREAKRKVRVYISTVFGCPYQGKIAPETLSRVLRTVAAMVPDEIALGDTIGVATPDQVREIVGELAKAFPVGKIALHLHNTYGLATAAAQAGYERGVMKFDGATGGVGGCPYAKGASGNVASEDLLYAFYRQGAREVFPEAAFQKAIAVLAQDLKMVPQGHLSQIWQKGGTLYGI